MNENFVSQVKLSSLKEDLVTLPLRLLLQTKSRPLIIIGLLYNIIPMQIIYIILEYDNFEFIGKLVKELSGHNAAVTHINIISNVKFATGSADGNIIIWSGYKIQYMLTGYHQHPITFMAMRNDYLYSADKESINIWDTNTGILIKTFLAGNHIDILTDGRIVTATYSGDISIWDKSSTINPVSMGAAFDEHNNKINITHLKALPNGKFITIKNNKPSILLWDIPNTEKITPYDDLVKYIPPSDLSNVNIEQIIPLFDNRVLFIARYFSRPYHNETKIYLYNDITHNLTTHRIDNGLNQYFLLNNTEILDIAYNKIIKYNFASNQSEIINLNFRHKMGFYTILPDNTILIPVWQDNNTNLIQVNTTTHAVNRFNLQHIEQLTSIATFNKYIITGFKDGLLRIFE